MQQHSPDATHQYRLRTALWRLRHVGPWTLLNRMRRRLFRPAWYMSMALWIGGCITPALTPTPTPSPPPPTAAAGWETLSPGLERRIYQPPDALFTRLLVLRIDPTQYRFRAHYRPGEPLSAAEWQQTLTDAAVIINANFFDPAHQITGMLISDGVRYGSSYQRRGGTFSVNDGQVYLQSHLVQPFNGADVDQAIQAFPMLMTNGAQSYFDERPDRPTRRTVIAIDAQGRVVILVTTFGGITLLDLAKYLPTTDLDLVSALNLDGGGSTLVTVNTPQTAITLESFDPVPAVFAVYPQELR